MKGAWLILVALLAAASVGLVVWMASLSGAKGGRPQPRVAADHGPAVSGAAPLRIGLVPERDIFEVRKRFRPLADYLAVKLERPVELVTLNSYQSTLHDFDVKDVDAAFLGSFITVMAMDRLGAKVLVCPVGPDGSSTYRGVLIVADGSPIRGVDDLAGRSIAMVKWTTAGHLFPIYEMVEHGLIAPGAAGPRIVWVGTHDQVIDEVLAGRVDAGAVKDLRLNAFEADHPEARIRRLSTSNAVPNNVLVLRADLAKSLGTRLKAVLLNMSSDRAGGGPEALKMFGATKFEPCDCPNFSAVFKMIYRLGQNWDAMDITGPPPWCACVGTTRPEWSRTPSTAPDRE